MYHTDTNIFFSHLPSLFRISLLQSPQLTGTVLKKPSCTPPQTPQRSKHHATRNRTRSTMSASATATRFASAQQRQQQQQQQSQAIATDTANTQSSITSAANNQLSNIISDLGEQFRTSQQTVAHHEKTIGSLNSDVEAYKMQVRQK